ncbi:MAG: GNAT family N-acetyltransferase [Glaciimonas sp.]|nr:GNAT family N-acetyltransferase [Glaciimonas sp.]
MALRIGLGDWATQKSEAQAIRYAVFVLEQKVPLEMEWDEMDAQCLHAVAFMSDSDDVEQAVGTGRLLPDGHIGRMAVLKQARGSGVGAALLLALMQQAQRRGQRQVELSAQTHAEVFYARYGFVREGEQYQDAGIPHVHMRHIFDERS